MKRILFAALVLGLVAAVGGVAYQAAALEREYRSLIARGDAAQRVDQTFVAIEAFSGAIALKPDSMLAHLRRGEIYQRRGDLDAAARDLRTASRLDPTATRPLEQLGDVFYARQRYDRAAQSYEAYLRLDDRRARVHYKLALTRYREGNAAGAIGPLTQAVRLDNQLADAHYLLGVCLRERKRLGEAVTALEYGVTVAPGLVAAREELADLYTLLGRKADAIEQLQLLAGLDRGQPERQVALGLAHARAGHTDLAILTLGSAAERFPQQPAIYAALGRVWLDTAETRNDKVALGKALEAFQGVATRPSASSETLTLYGRALMLAGDFDAAERTLRQASERYPIDPAALLHFATAAQRLGDLAGARTALIRYGELAPDDADLAGRATRIAGLSMRLSDPATAVLWLQRAIERGPSDVRLLGQLAEAQLKAGDAAGARVTLARALERDPRNPALLALNRRAR